MNRQNNDNTPNKPSFRLYLMTALIMSVIGCTQQTQNIGGAPESAAGRKIAEKLSPVATKIIEESLSDENPQVRANAIETVADNKMTELMPKIGQMLKDEIVPVRFAATMAIADTDYQPAKFYLDRLIKDKDENVRVAAIYASAKLNYPANLQLYGKKKANLEYFKTLEPLGKAITSSDQTIRANTALILGKSGSTKMLELLYWAQNDEGSSPKVRFQTAESIARLGDKEIYPKLWTLLISKYIENKIIGIRAMGALGTAESQNALITMLNDEVPEIRLAAAEQLGILGNNIGQPVVLAFIEEMTAGGSYDLTPERVKVLAAMAIGRIGTAELNRYLPQLIADKSKIVKIAAADAVLKQIIAN